jgi:hypothetical protein
MVRQKRACIFPAKDIALKCTGKSNTQKEEQKRINCENYCQQFMSKEVVLKHPCMTTCRITNEIVIRTGYEKGEELKGEGEIGGMKG